MKKVEPYTESAIEKGASTYSKTCNIVNITPKNTVKLKPFTAWSLFPDTILWWAHVTVAPELNKIAVLSKGTEKGFKACIPRGGHWIPISIAGDKLLWKKAQKKEKNNNISETIKRINPIFKPCKVLLVWKPWYVLSLITSFNQKYKQRLTDIKPINNNQKLL